MKTLLLIFFIFFLGCQEPQHELTYTPSATPDCAEKPKLALQDTVYIPTFYRDVLPILDSRRNGEVYKCTTCHAAYRQPEGSNSVAKVQELMKAIGPSGRMPTRGDKVKESDMQMIKRWRLKGFKTGKIEQFVARIDPVGTSSYGTNTNQIQERDFNCDPPEE